MTTPVWVVWCEDTECRRTLATSLRGVAPVVSVPPESGPWMLMSEASCLRGKTFKHPPCQVLLLGDDDRGAGLPHAEAVPLPLRLQDVVAQLRRMSSCPPPGPRPLLEDSLLLLDAGQRCLKEGATGQQCELTEKETLLLQALMTAGDTPLSREALLAEVWAYQPEVNTRTLETHLSRLRAKLQQFPSARLAIVSDDGGYRLALQE